MKIEPPNFSETTSPKVKKGGQPKQGQGNNADGRKIGAKNKR